MQIASSPTPIPDIHVRLQICFCMGKEGRKQKRVHVTRSQVDEGVFKRLPPATSRQSQEGGGGAICCSCEGEVSSMAAGLARHTRIFRG